MKNIPFGLLVIAAIGIPSTAHSASVADPGATCLVASHVAGRIQSMIPGDAGAPARSFAEALPALNAMEEGPDGFIYASTGTPSQGGTIVRIDPATGIPSGTFWHGTDGGGRAVGRITGITKAGGDFYVAEGDAGKIHRIDALSGEWKGLAAESAGAVFSQIWMSPKGLLAADFNGQRIVRFPRNPAGGFDPAVVVLSTAPNSPWAVHEDDSGRIFYSTNADGIFRTEPDGAAPAKPWITGEAARQVIYLGLSRDGGTLLVTSSGSGKVSGWPVHEPASQALWERQFPAADLVSSSLEPSPRKAEAAETLSLRQTGQAGESPTAGLLVKALKETGLITHLGWDTEGGGRESNNLLRRPFRFSLRAGESDVPLLVETLAVTNTDLTGQLAREKGQALGSFRIALVNGKLTVSAELDPIKAGADARLTLALELNPRMCATSFHATDWTFPDTGRLPGLLIAPDMGTMAVTSALPTEARFTGSRKLRETTLAFSSPADAPPKLVMGFAPVTLENPTPGKSEELWLKARRGWWNLPLATSQWGPTDGTDGSLAGVWGNNIISNPVGSTLFWLVDHVLLQPKGGIGLAGADFLRHTVEYHLTHKITPEGEVLYVNRNPGAMDANPALIIGFWGVVEATGDMEWMKKWWPKLAPAIAYLEARDVDDDGLIESKLSGNAGTGAFGDTAFDTYSSGHKNAYVNVLAHRAFKCLEALAGKSGDAEGAARYGGRAAKLKASFRKTFFNPETGWIAWWRSLDGALHDVHSDVPTSLATLYGLLEPADAKTMLDKYWTALQGSGFNRFDLGVPLNYRPVPANLQFAGWGGTKADGSETFQRYLNGGAVVSTTMWFLVANYMAGNDERADAILEKMVKRQHKGFFPNGGGFQNGVVDIFPYGAEFYDWSGKTCGYEGHLVYSYNFLQAIPLRDPSVRERLFGFLGRGEKPVHTP